VCRMAQGEISARSFRFFGLPSIRPGWLVRGLAITSPTGIVQERGGTDRAGGHMHSTMAKWIVTAAVIAAASAIVGASAQQQARQPPARFEPAAPAKDYDQRALEIYEFRKAAHSGPARGEEIYFYKCWMCHNELAQGGAPKLVGLFNRATLASGEPLNDDTIRNQIRNGSANMP